MIFNLLLFYFFFFWIYNIFIYIFFLILYSCFIFIEENEELLNTLHKTKDELYESNKQLSNLQSNETSARFNEQKYRQEYEILKKQNEWQNQQLQIKNEEFIRYKEQKVL